VVSKWLERTDLVIFLDIVTLIRYISGTSRNNESLEAGLTAMPLFSPGVETNPMADSPNPRPPARPKARCKAKWTKIFLAELAATSNVSAAAKEAGVSTAMVYETRRCDAEFNRAWRMALCEGYDALEMALLQRFREGEVEGEGSVGRTKRAHDNAAALRLLSAHRETVARERACQDEQDADAILASIDAKIDRMRARWLAEKEGQGDGQ
jgi:hypothetical protein